MSDISDDDLSDLSIEIDENLYSWMKTYSIPALNLSAVILARLTWLSRQGGYEKDFVELLEAPKQVLEVETKKKDNLH